MAAGKLPAIFQGAINPEQGIALAHTASKDSALSFEDLMASLPTAAQGVNAAGGNAAEAAALVSVLSEGVADKTSAGNRIDLKVIAKPSDDHIRTFALSSIESPRCDRCRSCDARWNW